MTQPLILVVDDEPAIRDLLEQFLTDAGFAVNTAANGLDASLSIGNRIVDLVLTRAHGGRVVVKGPIARRLEGDLQTELARLRAQGFVRVEIDGAARDLGDEIRLDVGKHDLDVVVDRVAVRPDARQRLTDSVELALRLGSGTVLLTGDLWHLAESRAGKKVPRFNTDRTQTLASYEMTEALAAKTKALVVREHVPEDFDALPKFPAALK